MTEADKIRGRVAPLLAPPNSVIDLGCGNHPVVPWATGVDDGSESKILAAGVVRGRIEPDGGFLATLPLADVVFSSHAIEHMRCPILETLRYWLTAVKKGGRLVLYLPDESRYVYNPKNPAERNPGHHHYLTPGTFRWYVEQLPVEIEALEEDARVFDHYSFLVVARKR